MDQYRKEIDRIDAEIARLLDERLDVAAEIGRYKLERGLPVLDAAREKKKIDSLFNILNYFSRDNNDSNGHYLYYSSNKI